MNTSLHIRRLSLVALSLFIFLMAHADVTICYDGLYYSLDTTNKVARVTFEKHNYLETDYLFSEPSYTNLSGDVVIPSSIVYYGRYYPVVGITAWAFQLCYKVTSFTIPESITFINKNAFAGCSGIDSINLPPQLTEIAEESFYDCRKLTTIKLPDSLRAIGNNAFKECSSLTSISWPNSLRVIGNNAFEKCSSLTTVNWPDSLKEIGECAFNECSSLRIDKLPENLESVSRYGFCGCAFADSLYVPASLKTMGTAALWGATSICFDAPNCVSGGLGGSPFPSVQNLYIGDKVEQIPDYLCYKCTNLTSLTISRNVTSIQYYSFYGCSEIKQLTWNAIKCASQLHAEQRLANLECVTIGEEVEYLPSYFVEGSKITSVVIPDNVKSIATGAFRNCANLTSVNFGNSLTNIGISAFENCSKLTSIDLPASLRMIQQSAFKACGGLTSLYIPQSVSMIGDNAFYNCRGLTSISVDPNNKNFDSRNNCNALINSITNKLIRGCNSTIIPDSVQSIGYAAFLGCTRLLKVTLPETVTTIGGLAFEYCTSLLEITLPESLATIGDLAFGYCNHLSKITCHAQRPPQVKAISGSYNSQTGSFVGVNTSIPVYVPKSTIQAYWTAEGWSAFTNIIALDDTPTTGDFNGDGVVDIADVNICCNLMLGKGDPRATADEADVNGDGVVDIADVNLVINAMLGKQ